MLETRVHDPWDVCLKLMVPNHKDKVDALIKTANIEGITLTFASDVNRYHYSRVKPIS